MVGVVKDEGKIESDPEMTPLGFNFSLLITCAVPAFYHPLQMLHSAFESLNITLLPLAQVHVGSTVIFTTPNLDFDSIGICGKHSQRHYM